MQVLLAAHHCLASGITLPGVGYWELGRAAPVVWELLLVALAESVRVTDGIDGVLCGTAFAAMLGLMVSMTLLGWFPLAVLPGGIGRCAAGLSALELPPGKAAARCGRQLVRGRGAGLCALGHRLAGSDPAAGTALLVGGRYGGGADRRLPALKRRRQLFATAPLHRWLEKRGRDPVTIFYIFTAIALLGIALTVQMAKIS